MVDIEIDGKKIQAQEGAMVIEAADDAGIYIPRFCYHKKLSIAANCRMCLVEVEKAGKPLPACATPVTDGMKVHTRSSKAIAAQKGVMEFLLINHPLDCPICDQGGECELQDIAMGYGGDVSTFTEQKRVVPNKDFGPFIAGDMTRCIHCTRCVRFGEEIAGLKELGATGRGEHMEIGTYVQHSLVSEMSGNVIDLCPVGALTSKPFRFQARAWEIIQHDSIAPHDCIGSNLELHTFRHEVVRVVPRENEQINETWLSDRDRYSYEGLNSEQRLTSPRVKTGGEWQDTDWNTALEYTVKGLQGVIDKQGADSLAALVSPNATVEESYLLQKLLRALGSNHIDHRLRQRDFSDQDRAPRYPWLGQSIPDLEASDCILLVGTNIRADQPIAGHRVRKAALRGASILCLNPQDYDFHFPLDGKVITPTSDFGRELAAIIRAVLDASKQKAASGLDALLQDIQPGDTHKNMAARLLQAQRVSIVMGHDTISSADFAVIRSLVQQLAVLSGAVFGYLSDGCNAAGACLSGVLPHRGPAGEPVASPGKNVNQMISGNMAAYVLLGVEPEQDCVESGAITEALHKADFVVSLCSYENESANQYADVLLPISLFAETSGTYVNAEGRWQSFDGAVEPRGESRPAWKIIRVLGNLLQCEGFDYVHSHEVRDDIHSQLADASANNIMQWVSPTSLSGKGQAEVVISRGMYSGDSLQRHAEALQKMDELMKSRGEKQ